METNETKADSNLESLKPGRPSKYGSISLYQVEVLSRLGLTDPQMAEALGISDRTFNRYKKQKEFWQAIKKGKRISDKKVESSLFHRAIGYSHPETILMQHRGKVIREVVLKRYPPDTTACIFWLKNRQPQEWRDKQELDHSGSMRFANMTNEELFKYLQENDV